MREKIGSKQIENILSVTDAQDELNDRDIVWDSTEHSPSGDAFFFSGDDEVAVWVGIDNLLIIQEAAEVREKPADLVDSVVGAYGELQGEAWFAALSLDSQGEIAVKVARMIEERVTETRMEMLKEEMIRVEKQQESLQVTYEYLEKEVERMSEDV